MRDHPRYDVRDAVKYVACLDYYAHVLLCYSNEELREILDVAKTGKVGDSSVLREHYDRGNPLAAVWGHHYKEAQFHGQISLSEHIERIVVPTSYRHAHSVPKRDGGQELAGGPEDIDKLKR